MVEIVREKVKALKFSLRIGEKTSAQMKEAIARSAALDKECGFSFCDDNPSPISCDTSTHVSFPACKSGRLKGGFHVHLKSSGISGMDIVSSIATDADLDCIGYRDGSIQCYDIKEMGARDKELSEEMKTKYKEVIENAENDEEAGRQLSAVAREAAVRLKNKP